MSSQLCGNDDFQLIMATKTKNTLLKRNIKILLKTFSNTIITVSLFHCQECCIFIFQINTNVGSLYFYKRHKTNFDQLNYKWNLQISYKHKVWHLRSSSFLAWCIKCDGHKRITSKFGNVTRYLLRILKIWQYQDFLRYFSHKNTLWFAFIVSDL